MGVQRRVQWPHDVEAVARSLSSGEGANGWFWLDGNGSSDDDGRSHSYLGRTSEIVQAEGGNEAAFLDLLRSEVPRPSAGDDEFSAKRLMGLDSERQPAAPRWVLALSYEFGARLMSVDEPTDTEAPAFALRVSTVLVLDHRAQVAELHGPDNEQLDRWLSEHGSALYRRRADTEASPSVNLVADQVAAPQNVSESSTAPVRWRQSDDDYVRHVESCRSSIRDGEAYVICLTDTAEQVLGRVDPLDLYLRLRESALPTRGAVIVAGDRALVSASPERFLSVRGEVVQTHPIKGTRPRGVDAQHDEALAAELVSDPKERAENLMIVDLMRNDLSRVCMPESVAAEGFLRVETHAKVHQLVSTVSGKLRPGHDVFDVIRASFPGGSMTGAPKHRAMQLLSQLEAGPRGLYSGCFGWIGEQQAELAMSIRGIELRGLGGSRTRALVGAGGGITSDSDSAAELAEKHLKAQPMLAALLAVQTE